MAEQYPLFPGFREPTTSREAAEAIHASGKAPNLRQRIIEWFCAGHSATADEVARRFGESPLTTRPRVTELYKMGLIERTGERRASSEGRPSHVYRRKVQG